MNCPKCKKPQPPVNNLCRDCGAQLCFASNSGSSIVVDHVMMLPCAATGFILQKILKWTIGGFVVGWEVARREKSDKTNNDKRDTTKH